MGKLSNYWHTVKHLKPEQIIYRVTGKLGMDCSLGAKASTDTPGGPIALLPRLDFDPVFLDRFPAEELMLNRVSLLHESEDFDWSSPWKFDNRTPLWNYNLHYFEYLFPLIHAWQKTKEPCYLDKIREMIGSWISANPRGVSPGWDAYPTSLRLVCWLSCYGYLEADLDDAFKQRMIASMAEQYDHLAVHLEKHLLGNHYFENLKTLVICAIFFRDERMLWAALKELKKQCAEQILPDGMHFELSPMYHKIILEDLLRTAAALRLADRQDKELEQYLQPMADVAYSLEEGLERIPLFNDCGNNITKALDALLVTAGEKFGIKPQYKSQLPDSGYYIFKAGHLKLIVDAGQPGPDYLPGHAHCDAMSFELFHKGQPILVNCGTYAYQCQERNFFRSTGAHNTVSCNGTEQSQCWGNFRMAKRASVKVLSADPNEIRMELVDYSKNTVRRTLRLDADGLTVIDMADGKKLTSWLHRAETASATGEPEFDSDVRAELVRQSYCADFGKKQEAETFVLSAENRIRYRWRQTQ